VSHDGGARHPRPVTPVRILVVDDVPLFRGAIAAVLDDQPDFHVVGEAGNGLDAVEQAVGVCPDVVVMDVEMPVMDGIEAARRIRERCPRARIIMLTAFQDDERLLEAVRLGVHGFLLKDLRPDQLVELIRSVVRGESPVAPALVTRLLAELRGTGRDAATRPPAPEHTLSARELEILQLVAHGLSNREIGRRLSITEGTVKTHVHNALQKLNMDNRIQAAAYIVRQGLGVPAR